MESPSDMKGKMDVVPSSVIFRNLQRGDPAGQISQCSGNTNVFYLKQKEHTQRQCHQKGAYINNTDILSGVGAHLQGGCGTLTIGKWRQVLVTRIFNVGLCVLMFQVMISWQNQSNVYSPTKEDSLAITLYIVLL